MKPLLLLSNILLFFAAANGQSAKSGVITIPAKYEVVVFFGSMCCGPASDDFLKDFITHFNSTNKVTINTWQMTGCGREGESRILFSLVNLNKEKCDLFLSSIKTLVPSQNEKNKTVNASIGNISLSYDVLLSSLSNCRGPLSKYKL